jgi:hypothetical protein
VFLSLRLLPLVLLSVLELPPQEQLLLPLLLLLVVVSHMPQVLLLLQLVTAGAV